MANDKARPVRVGSRREPEPAHATRVVGQVQDVEFLVEEFDVTVDGAADLVARDGQDRDALEDAARAHQAIKDPLAGQPTPQEPENDLTEDSDEERLMPVLHRRNDRSGGG